MSITRLVQRRKTNENSGEESRTIAEKVNRTRERRR